jgi:hypothetical protein
MIVKAGRSAAAARYLWHGHAAAIVAAPTCRSLHAFAMPNGCTAHGLRKAACSRNAARRIAVNIAKLPVLLKKD